jgi:hypothetical protein
MKGLLSYGLLVGVCASALLNCTQNTSSTFDAAPPTPDGGQSGDGSGPGPDGGSNSWFVTGQNASRMLSGVGFNQTGGALKFNHPSGIASDGTRFLLCDRFNNRVLVWNTLPTSWNAAPDIVLGQTSFETNNSGSSLSEMNWPGNVSVASNGVVAVADTENDRILIWLKFPTASGQAADVALSLRALALAGGGQSEWPWGVWTDGTRLAVTATHGGKILFWNSLPTGESTAPDYIVSHPDFGTLRNIATDGKTYFFVGDHNAKVGGSNRPGTFFWNSFPSATDQPYDFFHDGEWIKGTTVGDGRLITGGLMSFCIWSTVPTSATEKPTVTIKPETYSNGDAPDIVYAGGKTYVNNYNGNDVLVYDGVPETQTAAPLFALGHEQLSANTLDDIGYIQNPVIATDGTLLIITSDFDQSLSIWKTQPTASGVAPDVKIALGQSGQGTGNILAPWDNALHGGRLVIAGKETVAIWDTVPLDGRQPDRFFKGSIGSVSFKAIKGVALDQNYFYLAIEPDTLAIWKGLPTAGSEEPLHKIIYDKVPLNRLNSDGTYLTVAVQNGSPLVDIYRVADLESGSAPNPIKRVERSADLLLNMSSSAITFDGSLAIADTNSSRVIIWRDLNDAPDLTKATILGQANSQGVDPGLAANRLFMPNSLAATPLGLWVGEIKFSSRVLYFDRQ